MNTYLVIILAILIGNYILSLIVEGLNVGAAKPDLPDEFKDCYSSDKYKKSQEYLKEKTYFNLIYGGVLVSIMIALILSGGFNLVDNLARGLNLNEILTGLIFIGLLFLGFQILDIPFSIYSTFVIEQKYGFNRTTPKTFCLDILKGWLLAVIIGGLVYIGSVLYEVIKDEGWEAHILDNHLYKDLHPQNP